MKHSSIAICLAIGAFLAAPAFPQSDAPQGQGKAIVTILPKKDGVAPASVSLQDMSLKIGGKAAKITAFQPYQSPENNIELVLLIDESSRSSLSTQMGEITSFINSLPPNIKSAIAYMQFGRAVFPSQLSTDHAQVLRALHIPGGLPGTSASPYFCLSDLAKHWPSQDPAARREVVMISDGVDPYYMQYDPDNPYLQAAIADSLRAHLVVDSVYWESIGTRSNRRYENMTGQSYLNVLSQATGGKSFWMGMGNPVSFDPYFKELVRRFQHQYELSFTASLVRKPQMENMKLKFSAQGVEVTSPQQTMVYPVFTMKN